jgi:hypothetical protein
VAAIIRSAFWLRRALTSSGVTMSTDAQALDVGAQKIAEDAKHFNTMALAGVALGVISLAAPALGVAPVMGIVFSTLGITTFNPPTEKMRWMGSFGLGLSILVTLLRFQYGR